MVAEYNYIIVFDGARPNKAQVETVLNALPNKHETSLPPILTFLPREGLVPNSARYILGPESLKAFAPELASTKPGFDEGAEAQVAQYRVGKGGTCSTGTLLLPDAGNGAIAHVRVQTVTGRT